ncbi:IS1096 element passenger TnpR family protein [Methanoplanus endosymbiosus]|uniref:Plasmid pRiA4b Orf3-like domain-containing protein n=1 Tax=Methanoplanus endosymbiosus TaxID=33865 RepID=A0A9E7TL29_9EURY|nr:hypothetical protein [Methanoplanus endosymbiosus]UUX93374.1 hypothetical protein L6E24_04410 [Methanoplanus endosymbiosus]
MTEKKVFVFKIAFKVRKSFWRRIEIRGDQTLGEFDRVIRTAFGLDMDHLSQFYPGKIRDSCGYGYIEPGGYGEGADPEINELGLDTGDTIEYVYDFGANVQHTITLEEVKDAEEGKEYPEITGKSKRRNHYCQSCKKENKKTVAVWICVDCTDMEGKMVYICDKCREKYHGDHYAEEIIY